MVEFQATNLWQKISLNLILCSCLIFYLLKFYSLYLKYNKWISITPSVYIMLSVCPKKFWFLFFFIIWKQSFTVICSFFKFSAFFQIYFNCGISKLFFLFFIIYFLCSSFPVETYQICVLFLHCTLKCAFYSIVVILNCGFFLS